MRAARGPSVPPSWAQQAEARRCRRMNPAWQAARPLGHRKESRKRSPLSGEQEGLGPDSASQPPPARTPPSPAPAVHTGRHFLASGPSPVLLPHPKRPSPLSQGTRLSPSISDRAASAALPARLPAQRSRQVSRQPGARSPARRPLRQEAFQPCCTSPQRADPFLLWPKFGGAQTHTTLHPATNTS